MKTIYILKRLITFYYYILAIGVCIEIVKAVNNAFDYSELKSKIFDLEIDFSSMGVIKTLVILMIPVLLYFLFFRAINILKYSLDDLEEGNFFTERLVSDFKKVGVLFIVCSLGRLISYIALRIILKTEEAFKIGPSAVLFLLMGLFFMFLSEVFLKAKKLQEENELTV